MEVSMAFLLAISLFLLFLHESTALIPQINVQASCRDQEDHRLICQLEEAKLMIARLESILEESISDLSSKSLYLRESEKLIEEMTREIDRLQSALLSLKDHSSPVHERLNGLEEEVRLLWAILRKNNFELHTLESKAQDAEKRLERATSRVEKMAEIVTEQWIQVQQLEQALQIANTNTMKVKRQVSSTRCSLVKFITSRFGNHIENLRIIMDPYSVGRRSYLSSYVSQALHELERTFSAVKRYHHQLQGFVKHEMEKNEYTAVFANEEVVFFMASSLITFPLLCMGMLLLSKFS